MTHFSCAEEHQSFAMQQRNSKKFFFALFIHKITTMKSTKSHRRVHLWLMRWTVENSFRHFSQAIHTRKVIDSRRSAIGQAKNTHQRGKSEDSAVRNCMLPSKINFISKDSRFSRKLKRLLASDKYWLLVALENRSDRVDKTQREFIDSICEIYCREISVNLVKCHLMQLVDPRVAQMIHKNKNLTLILIDIMQRIIAMVSLDLNFSSICTRSAFFSFFPSTNDEDVDEPFSYLMFSCSAQLTCNTPWICEIFVRDISLIFNIMMIL